MLCQINSKDQGKRNRFENLQNGFYTLTRVTKASIIDSFFVSIFTEENLNAIPNQEIGYILSELNDLSITPEIVQKNVK